MNALSLYLSTCRYVMSASPDNKESWEDLYRYLPYLRQALSCSVCRNILVKPMGPTHNVCQHFVCHKCLGGKMKFKPRCSWCKNHDEYKEHSQLKLVVACYQKLCEYISNSYIGDEISSINTINGEKNNLLLILQEALSTEDGYKLTPSSSISVPAIFQEKIKKRDNGPDTIKIISHESEPMASTSRSKTTAIKKASIRWKSRRKKFASYKLLKKNSIKNINSNQETGDLSVSVCSRSNTEIKNDSKTSVTVNENMESSTKKKKEQSSELVNEQKQKIIPDSFKEKGDNSNINPPLKKPKLIPASQNEIRICKCGRGGQNSRLTCLGQRCPCYIKRLPCIGCKCKGCRNPRKAVNLEPPLLIQESFRTVNSGETNFMSVSS